MRPPCYNCQEREVGCHSRCDKYKEWTAQLEKSKESKRQEQRLRDLEFNYKKDKHRRLTGKRN